MTGYQVIPWGWRHAFFCWQLAHEPSARAQFFDPRPPTLWRHLLWCWDRSRVPSAWIMVVSGQLAGLFWVAEDQVVSVNVDPRYRGYGFGAFFIQDATRLAHQQGIRLLQASVKNSNVVSLGAFRVAGYEIASRLKHVTLFRHSAA